VEIPVLGVALDCWPPRHGLDIGTVRRGGRVVTEEPGDEVVQLTVNLEHGSERGPPHQLEHVMKSSNLVVFRALMHPGPITTLTSSHSSGPCPVKARRVRARPGRPAADSKVGVRP